MIYCHYNQKVGQHAEDTYSDSKSPHQFADCVPFCEKILSTKVIKEGNEVLAEMAQQF